MARLVRPRQGGECHDHRVAQRRGPSWVRHGRSRMLGSTRCPAVPVRYPSRPRGLGNLDKEQPMSWLEGKTVLITGAGGGIGQATCLAFAGEGAVVVGLDLHDDWLEGVRKQAGSAAGVIHAVVGDATSANDVALSVQRGLDLNDRLDVAV